MLESYCVFVRDTAAKFVTEDSLNDARVDGHAKQQHVQSYCGLPLLTDTGELFGTVCHFDFDAIPFAPSEVMVLEDIAPHLVAAVLAGDWKPVLPVAPAA